MDLQKMFDAMGDAMRRTRSDYHLTLGGLISALEAAPEADVVAFDTGGHPGRFGSYRGYYADIAIKTEVAPITVRELLFVARDALGRTFEGYKGGDFTMGEDTPLWVAEYGITSGVAVVRATQADGRLVLTTAQID